MISNKYYWLAIIISVLFMIMPLIYFSLLSNILYILGVLLAIITTLITKQYSACIILIATIIIAMLYVPYLERYYNW